MAKQFKNGYALLIGVNENINPTWALPDVKKDVQALQNVLIHPERCAYLKDNVKIDGGNFVGRDNIVHGNEIHSDNISGDKISVGNVSGKGVAIGKVKGNITIRNSVKQTENTILNGDFVNQQTITNNILVLGPNLLEEIVKSLTVLQGVKKQTLRNLGTQDVPENVSRQITEIVAAQKEAEKRGVLLNPQAAYNLGMLAAYDRKYEQALAYFHNACDADSGFSDAFEAIALIQ